MSQARSRAGRARLVIAWNAVVGTALILGFVVGDAAAQSAAPIPTDSLVARAGSGEPPMSQLRDIGDVLSDLFGKTKIKTEAELQPRPGLSIVALPSIGYNPAYGGYIGVGASAGGWFGDPAITKVSVFALNATYSTQKQLTIQFKSDAWIPGNKWNFKGDARYLDTSQPTYGLGPTDAQLGKYPMDFRMWRFYETVYRRTSGSIYVGFGYHLNIHDDINDQRAAAGETTPFTVYSRGAPRVTTSSGLSGNVLIDNRDSPIFTRLGMFWNASLRFYNRGLGSNDDWQELLSDFRAYPTIPRGSRNVLALWNSLWMTFGHAPYLDLPAIGWDTYGKSGRGYVQGRLRAPNQIYQEAEYRFLFTRDELFGGVVFINATASTLPTANFGPLDPGVGLGLRMKFIKRTRTNLTLDYGWGNDSSKGLYLGTQEVF
jgi:hypothetical protein